MWKSVVGGELGPAGCESVCLRDAQRCRIFRAQLVCMETAPLMCAYGEQQGAVGVWQHATTCVNGNDSYLYEG